MTENPVNDPLDSTDRVYLDKLLLATSTILRLGEDNVIPAPLESELTLFRDRIERVLLS